MFGGGSTAEMLARRFRFGNMEKVDGVYGSPYEVASTFATVPFGKTLPRARLLG